MVFSLLCNNPEEWWCSLHLSGNLKSRIFFLPYWRNWYWRQHILLECWWTTTVHGTASQKTNSYFHSHKNHRHHAANVLLAHYMTTYICIICFIIIVSYYWKYYNIILLYTIKVLNVMIRNTQALNVIKSLKYKLNTCCETCILLFIFIHIHISYLFFFIPLMHL
jgi:hypothetical protein